MSGIRFAEKLAGAPWMCSQDHLEFLHGIFLSYMDRGGQPPDIQAIEEQIGRPLDNARKVTVRGGVARIPVTGTIFRRANLFTAMSGGTSAGVLAQDLRAAADDPSIDSILMVFDSPGGEAAGIHELAGMIRTIRDEGRVSIESYADGDCASAAYWLASATERITADATAVVGSIGVVTQVRNPEAAGKQQTLEFTNARSPKKRINPATESGRAALQEFVDDMGDEFIEAVAENRGVSVETVEQNFGQGFVMTGRKGVGVGLVDALGSEEEVLARLNSNGSYSERMVAMETGANVQYERGVLDRIRSLVGADVPTVPIQAETNEGSNVKLEERDGAAVLVADNGEELQLSAEDRNRLTEERQTEREAALLEENEDLKRQITGANAQVETLRAHTADGQARLKAEQVERELDTFAGEGVPKYMLDLARPALLSGGDEEAERWRSVLAGAKGSIEYGERGEGAGQAPGEMTDDQKVRAAIAERGLDPAKDYGKVAGELVAAGEIRRGDASQEGE